MTLDEQGVAALQANVAHLLLDALAVARHRDDHGVVVGAELGLANRQTRQASPSDHRFDEAPMRTGVVDLEQLVGRGHQPWDLLQVDHRLDDAHEHQAVVGLQPRGGLGGDDVLAPLDLHQVHARETAKARVLHRAAHDRALLLHHHLDHVLPRVVELGVSGPAVGQQPLGGDRHVGDADDGRGNADPGDVEHREALLPRGGQHEAVDHQGGRGADQGDQAAEDRRVRQRQQQLADRQVPPPCPVGHHGHHHRDDRGVVEEGAERCDRAHQAELGRGERRRAPQQLEAHEVDTARAAQALGHDEQRGDGGQALVGEPAERLGRGEDPGHQQGGQARQQDHVGRDAREREASDHRRQHHERDRHREGHRVTSRRAREGWRGSARGTDRG